jgi:hypothetical protein
VSKVDSINIIRRTDLEGENSPAEERVPGGTWNRDPKLIFESQQVELVFRCGDEQLKTVLNRMATATNVVLHVRQIAVESERTSPREPEGGVAPQPTARQASALEPRAGVDPRMGFDPRTGAFDPRRVPEPRVAAPAQPARPEAPAEPSLVMGKELATVTMRLDVIEVKPPQEAADGKAEPAKESKPKEG